MSTAVASPFAAFFNTAKQEPVYVILGVQGSGTNLLRSILVSAFNFSVVQDGSVIYNAAARLEAAPSSDSVRRQYEVIRSRLFPSALTRKSRRLIKGNASFTGIDEHFDPTEIRTGADLARFVYAYGAFSLGTKLMAIKSDDLWERIDQIDSVLPNRRIILLTRDFRDNLVSISKKDFGPIEPLVAARYVKERFAYYDAEFRRSAPDNRYHVRYEDLLESPSAFVAAFREHFTLETVPDAGASLDALRIRRHNVKKWAGLDRLELARCEAMLKDELLAYGYPIECEPVEPPGYPAWLLARGRDTIRRIPQKLGGVARRLRN